MTCGIGAACAIAAGDASGQGCEPIRFLTPSLGGQTFDAVRAHAWRIDVSSRRVATNQFFVGTVMDTSKAPGGRPIDLNINSLNVSVSYGLSSRLGLSFTVPFVIAKEEHTHSDLLRHSASATGVGDINLMGTLWVMNPANHAGGNLLLGLGLKAPTGRNDRLGAFYTKDGTPVQFPATQAIQAGDDGWGILLSTQAFYRVVGGLSAYASGSYVVNPRTKTTVEAFPNVDGLPQGILWSVPDVYSARFGTAYMMSESRRLSVNVGARLDGIPREDLIGGADDGVRRVGHTWYLDPGVSAGVGPGVFTLSVPIRLAAKSKPDVAALAGAPNPVPGHPVGGNFAPYIIFAGYSFPL